MPPDLNEQALNLYLNNPYEFIIILRSDLMNPLNVIHGAADLLADMLDETDLNTEEMKKFTQIMLQNAERLRSIFDEILEYERVRRDTDYPDLPDKQ